MKERGGRTIAEYVAGAAFLAALAYGIFETCRSPYPLVDSLKNPVNPVPMITPRGPILTGKNGFYAHAICERFSETGSVLLEVVWPKDEERRAVLVRKADSGEVIFSKVEDDDSVPGESIKGLEEKAWYIVSAQQENSGESLEVQTPRCR